MRTRSVRSDGFEVAAALGPLATFAVAGALVGVRGEIRPEVTALALAAVVALSGRYGGRAGGIASALMAALAFDFMHTKPYLSLKISSGDDILITLLLLVVGVVVGGLSGQASEDRRRAHNRANPGGLDRVLAIARDSGPEDVELAVRAEVLSVLKLRDCWFTADAVSLPVVGPWGELELEVKRFTYDGFELPEQGVAVPVAAYGRTFGHLVCQTTPGAGVSIEARQVAASLGEVLGMAMSVASPAA
jgi:hypothetical protein